MTRIGGIWCGTVQATSNTSEQSDVRSIRDRLLDSTGVVEAIRRAQQAAIRRHAQAGRQIAVWRNSQVEWIDADTLIETAE